MDQPVLVSVETTRACLAQALREGANKTVITIIITIITIMIIAITIIIIMMTPVSTHGVHIAAYDLWSIPGSQVIRAQNNMF